MPDTLIDQGLTLMLVGMGTVFVFLTILVMGMSLMAAIVARYVPVKDEGVTPEEVAAITAAIALHRTKKH
jgi:oxaloacetate decarboxylase gamma subunit